MGSRSFKAGLMTIGYAATTITLNQITINVYKNIVFFFNTVLFIIQRKNFDIISTTVGT